MSTNQFKKKLKKTDLNDNLQKDAQNINSDLHCTESVDTSQ